MGTRVACRSTFWLMIFGLVAALVSGISTPPPAAAATTFVVDNTSDDGALTDCSVAPGDCSLRGAVTKANATAGEDAIHFLIPAMQCPGGICPITLTNGPITITEAVTIDGTTQVQNAGPQANVCATETEPSHMRIEVITDPSGDNASGLVISHATGSSTIRGLAIGTNYAGGVSLGINAAAGSGHHIECNHLGADAAGTAELGSASFYAVVATSGTTDSVVIGTDGDGVDDLAERNVFASDGTGVYINNNDHIRVSGNYFGMTADGTSPLSFGSIFMRQSSSNNLIGVEFDGVSDDLEVNYFAGDSPITIYPSGYVTTGNRMIGNVLGMTADGTPDPINRGIEIQSFGTDDTGYEIRSNVIVSSTAEAIYVEGTGSDMVIDGNLIGQTASGAIAANEVGITVDGSASPQISNNLIANSDSYGITIADSASLAVGSIGNCVVGNADGVINTTGSTASFENNWWGDVAGPSGEGPGTGDSVGTDIDFDPWSRDPFALCNEPPTAVDASYSVAEDAAIGHPVGVAPSLDDGTTRQFSIVSGDPGGVFTIDSGTGSISTAAALDYETTSAYALEFEVNDGFSSDTATVSVAVTNVAPIVADTTFSIAEDAAVGTPVGAVTAEDGAATLGYAITAGNTGGVFTIDAATGVITTNAALDFETNPSYQLTVAVDDGLLSSTATVAVNVTDVFELPQSPTFVDVPTTHTFYRDIEWLAASGITKGCNPPANDLFCPGSPVTRGQMAAFLHRALGDTLTPGASVVFTDTSGSVFAADIEWLASVGVTKGCNPPANDMYCPEQSVTRGQMAAFLVRAFGYTAGAGSDRFIDDDGSVFEADIERLAESGVTQGCNPPTNDRFCPNDHVTRAQMAAFLNRALQE